ncbi:DUF6249 domain-containing protein [Microbulbifer sp. HZ11]|uniref:DUF6249 domain-containing protein n=1 Tax=Microbulbifer sp. HZ11 TaxID=1453501 RepID=UPI001E34FE12|nr:DUF6249 domain-containing protein [Microbulbifer sp. HZ11]
MRAIENRQRGPLNLWALALVAAVGMGASSSLLAQEEEAVAPKPPVPPAPVVEPKPVEKEVTKQVRILRQDDGTLRIHTRDENGENADVEIDLGEAFGGKVTQRIYEKLEEKGILDEKGLVVEQALDSVPRNISIGIKADMERAERIRERAERAREHAERMHEHAYEVREEKVREQRSGGPDMDWLIGIVAIIAVFGTPILIVWMVTRNNYRKKQLLMENINRMVSEGRDIPPELLDAMDREGTNTTKDRGITLIAIGAAVFIWLSISAGVDVGSLGLIPLFIGIARYVNWKHDQKQAG